MQHSGVRYMVMAASLVIVIAGLRAGTEILMPFAVALFLAILNLPLVAALQRYRMPRSLAIVITVLVNGAILGALGLLLTRSLEAFVVALPRYVTGLQGQALAAAAWLEGHSIQVGPLITDDLLNPARVMDFVGGTLRSIATILTNVFLVLLIMIFVLVEASAFPAKFRAAVGRRDVDLSRLAKIGSEVQQYLWVKTLISLATGVLLGLWCWFLGVDFPLLWGLLGFLLNYVPNIGSIVAAIPPVLLALVQLGVPHMVGVIAGYLAVNFAIGNVIEPHVMGRRLGLSTLIVVLSLVFWGWIWGPMGMLLSVPLTMSVKILLENTKDFRWVAILLDNNPDPGIPGPSPALATGAGPAAAGAPLTGADAAGSIDGD